MLGKTVLVALVGALSVSANQVHSLVARSLHGRQITPSQIPSACQSQCTSALTIYQACTSGDTATCISVCGASNYSNFVGCLQCVLNNTPGVSTAEVSALNTIVGQLAGACQQAGSPVSSTSFVVSATGSGSRSASASGSSTGLIGGSGVVASSIASITGSGSASRSSALSTGAVASLTSGLSSAVASASSSRAAGQAQAILPQGIQAAFLGLAGIAGGAALVL